MSVTHPIPEAWPLLLTRDQLRAYLGGMAAETLFKVCPIPPVDLGANILRYSRLQIDAWVATLTPRAPRLLQDNEPRGQDAALEQPEPVDDAETRRQASLAAVGRRMREGRPRWKTAS